MLRFLFYPMRRARLWVQRDGEANHASDKRGGRQGVEDVREDGHVRFLSFAYDLNIGAPRALVK
jgi:hypothetical protein